MIARWLRVPSARCVGPRRILGHLGPSRGAQHEHGHHHEEGQDEDSDGRASPHVASQHAFLVGETRQHVVLLEGPPRVSRYTTFMSVKVNTVPKRMATVRMGSIMGMVIWKALASGPAPSMSAASWTSAGIDVSPARRMTVEKGRSRHTCTVMMATMPSVGSPSQ